MNVVATVAPRRHPWLDRLITAPAEEVRALAEGTAAVHPYVRAEPSDAAATLLFGLDADDPAMRAFDRGALAALEFYRAAPARVIGDERNRHALAVFDLLTAVQRLTPRDTAIDLHRRFAYWHTWAETLVLDRGLDLRREYARTLALTQDIAAEAGLQPRRLLPFWLDMCADAGARGRYDDSYLTVGLLGLRRLPLGDAGANEEAALHGLARWAERQRPPKARFLREWHVLEGAFPRDATFWTELVARVIASVEEEIARETKGQRNTFVATAWWREDVEAVRGIRLAPRHKDLEPPSRGLREAILADIDARRSFSEIEPNLQRLMRAHERYAIRTGDTFYLVRTACSIGMRLYRRGDVRDRRATRARELARLALRFEPANVYAWALWCEALAAEGHLEAAELVGWEAIRRFPEDPQWRTQLAKLLVDALARPEEAEALLRGTMEQFPDNVVARTQLALLLSDELGRLEEAKDLLYEAIQQFPNDVVARTQLALLLSNQLGRPEEAKKLLNDAVQQFRDDVVVRTQLALLLSERFDQPKEAELLLVETIALFPDNVVARTQLANVIGRDQNRLAEAIATLDGALAIDPGDGIAIDMKRRFERGRTSPPPKAKVSARVVAKAGGSAELVADIASTARARRALFRLRALPDAAAAAQQEVETLLREDGNFAYARYVAAAAGIAPASVDDTVMATAFLAAARTGSAEALRPFLERAQGLDRIVVALAGAVQGDAEAVASVTEWLKQPANDLSPREAAIRPIAARSGPVPLDLIGDMLAASLGTALAA